MVPSAVRNGYGLGLIIHVGRHTRPDSLFCGETQIENGKKEEKNKRLEYCTEHGEYNSTVSSGGVVVVVGWG